MAFFSVRDMCLNRLNLSFAEEMSRIHEEMSFSTNKVIGKMRCELISNRLRLSCVRRSDMLCDLAK